MSRRRARRKTPDQLAAERQAEAAAQRVRS